VTSVIHHVSMSCDFVMPIISYMTQHRSCDHVMGTHW